MFTVPLASNDLFAFVNKPKCYFSKQMVLFEKINKTSITKNRATRFPNKLLFRIPDRLTEPMASKFKVKAELKLKVNLL